MNIILTSCGIINGKIKEKFLSMLANKTDKCKILFITTAVDGEMCDDNSWIDREIKALINLGILKENIKEYKIGNELYEYNYDVIYMIGGNTFYLMNKIKEFMFDKVINDALNRGVMYVGSSAGSVIMGKLIDSALPFDENNVGMTDFSGLGYVDAVVIPHAQRKKEFIKQYSKHSKNNLLILNDNEGIVVRS